VKLVRAAKVKIDGQQTELLALQEQFDKVYAKYRAMNNTKKASASGIRTTEKSSGSSSWWMWGSDAASSSGGAEAEEDVENDEEDADVEEENAEPTDGEMSARHEQQYLDQSDIEPNEDMMLKKANNELKWLKVQVEESKREEAHSKTLLEKKLKDYDYQKEIFEKQLEKAKLESKLGVFSAVQIDFGKVLNNQLDMTEKEQSEIEAALAKVPWPAMRKPHEQKLAVVKEKLDYLIKQKASYERTAGISSILSTVSEPLNDIINKIMDRTSAKAHLVGGKVSPYVSPVVNKASNMYGAIENQVSPAMTKISKRVSRNAKKLKTRFNGALQTVGKAKRMVKNTVNDMWKTEEADEEDFFDDEETDEDDEEVGEDDEETDEGA